MQFKFISIEDVQFKSPAKIKFLDVFSFAESMFSQKFSNTFISLFENLCIALKKIFSCFLRCVSIKSGLLHLDLSECGYFLTKNVVDLRKTCFFENKDVCDKSSIQLSMFPNFFPTDATLSFKTFSACFVPFLHSLI